MTKKRLPISGMSCASCENAIRRAVKKIDGVKKISVNYKKAAADIEYDPDRADIKNINKVIESLGYSCKTEKTSAYGYLFAVAGLLVIGYFIFAAFENIAMPQISANMGYGLLFIVGLLTGFHCIAMCGGFVVSYTAKSIKEKNSIHKAHIYYGLSKTLSYTIIGAAFGLIGSIIAFTPLMRGVIGMMAGIFLLIFGIRMLDIIPAFRRFSIRMPGSINRLIAKISSKNNSPVIIGLLNGLMIACGPLQALYVMAAGTGSMIEGAKTLLFFGLGTLPAMIGFGYFTSIVSSRYTKQILKASGAVVIILGLLMINNGLSLTGSGYDFNSFVKSVNAENLKSSSTQSDIDPRYMAVKKDGYQEIRMEVTRYGWSPDKFYLEKGVPVRWIIDGKEITSCNNAIQVPKLGLKFGINSGEQVIEFTPSEEGVISWSCWMGMIPGVFIVTDDLSTTPLQDVQAQTKAASIGGSCGCGCGGH